MGDMSWVAAVGVTCIPVGPLAVHLIGLHLRTVSNVFNKTPIRISQAPDTDLPGLEPKCVNQTTKGVSNVCESCCIFPE